MIVLDTNVISELARKEPGPGVLSWLDSLEVSEVATTVITAAELRYGIARLPDGRRKRELAAVIRGILTEDFHGRVLPFDERASVRYAEVVTGREQIGRPISVADAQIAAICRDLGARLATRNIPDFEEAGIELDERDLVTLSFWLPPASAPRSSLPPKFASSPSSGARMTEDLPVQVAGAQPGCDDEWAELRVARARFVEAHLVDQFFENQRIVGEKVHAPFPVVETD